MRKTTKQATEPINSPIKCSQRSSQNAVLPHTSTGLKVFLQPQLLLSSGLQMGRRFKSLPHLHVFEPEATSMLHNAV